MKILRIEGLALEVEYCGGNAIIEAQNAIRAAQAALEKLGDDWELELQGTLIAMVRDEPDEVPTGQ